MVNKLDELVLVARSGRFSTMVGDDDTRMLRSQTEV